MTGTGRSGTGYMAAMLTAGGVPCGHEQVFGVNGYTKVPNLQADSSWLALPHLQDLWISGIPIILVYRHPARVVASFLNLQFFVDESHPAHAPYVQAMRDFAPEVFLIADPFERACEWYIVANQWAAKWAEVIEPLEDIRWSRIATTIGGLDWKTALPLIPSDTNKRGTYTEAPPLPQKVLDVWASLNDQNKDQ